MSSKQFTASYEVAETVFIDKPKRIIDQIGDMEVFKQTSKSLKAFSVVERNGEQYIHIPSELLRRFIWAAIDEQHLINIRYLYDEEKDTADIKLSKDKMSLFPFEESIKEWAWWFNENYATNHINNEHEKKLTPIVEEFEQFLNYWHAILTERYNQIFVQGGEISYVGLYFALQQHDDLYIAFDMPGNNIIAGLVHDVTCEEGSMMSPPYMEVTLFIHVHNGTDLIQTRYNHHIVEYKGVCNVADHGVRLLTPELKQFLKEIN